MQNDFESEWPRSGEENYLAEPMSRSLSHDKIGFINFPILEFYRTFKKRKHENISVDDSFAFYGCKLPI